MEEKNKIKEELLDLNSSLYKLEKNSSTDVPEGYFSNFEETVINRINSLEDKNKKESSLSHNIERSSKFRIFKINNSWSLAASIALLIGIVIFTLQNQREINCASIACMDQDMLQFYVEEHLEDYEALILDEVEVEQLYSTSALEELYLEELDVETIMEEL